MPHIQHGCYVVNHPIHLQPLLFPHMTTAHLHSLQYCMLHEMVYVTDNEHGHKLTLNTTAVTVYGSLLWLFSLPVNKKLCIVWVLITHFDS